MKPAEEYIIKQPEPFKSILLHLQILIEHTFPEAELKFKYGIPFYYVLGKPLCFFNASHKWQYVDVGFWKGNQIQVHKEHHVTENRKQMISLRYKTLEDINEAVFIDVIKEAVSLYST